MSGKNNKQDIALAELRTELNGFKNEFNRFRDNEFSHFKSSVEARINWLTGLVVAGILIPIVLFVIK